MTVDTQYQQNCSPIETPQKLADFSADQEELAVVQQPTSRTTRGQLPRRVRGREGVDEFSRDRRRSRLCKTRLLRELKQSLLW